MPDPRFFDSLGPVSLAEIAALTGAELRGGDPDMPILLAAPLAQSDLSAVTFLGDRRYAAQAAATKAGACFLNEAAAETLPAGCAALVTPAPQASWALAAGRLHQPKRSPPSDAWIHPQAELEDGVLLGKGAVVEAGARIGRGTTIGAGAVVGVGVAIGRDCRIGPRAVVEFALLGDRVTLLAGAVVGQAGFGAAVGPKGLVDVPQLGRVIIQDGVTIGAGTCVDRGAWDDTVIGENTKIDNMVQIAHNVRIGRNCAIAAQVGMSGSVIVGDGVQMGGQVGIADHAHIGDGAAIAAQSGITKGVPAGQVWAGYPARPTRQWARETAWVTLKAGKRARSDKEGA
jgi:UDP-3-O-[3-hydroxymyristoyl] glucosamine N-acyltransferase